MILVKVELHPFGEEKNKVELARGFIYNTGGTREEGNYNYTFTEVKDISLGKPRTISGEITKHPRLSSVFSLIKKCLG